VKRIIFVVAFALAIFSVTSIVLATTDTIGGTSYGQDGPNGQPKCGRINATSSGTLQTAGAYLGGTSAGQHLRIGVYSDPQGITSNPANLLGQSGSIASVNGWNDLSISNGVQITSGNRYWICVQYDTAGNYLYANTSGYREYSPSTSYADWHSTYDYGINIDGTMTYYLRMIYYQPLGNCTDGVATTPTLNYTVLDENNLTPLFSNIEMTHIINSYSYSFSYFNQSSFANCISPNTTTYQDSGTIQFVDNGSSYTTRYFWLDNWTISNQSQKINLYLLSSASGSNVAITLRDSSGNLLPNVYLWIERYYPSSNSYGVVEVLPTSAQGTTNAFLQLNTAYYQFVVTSGGKTLGTISQQLVSSNTLTLNLPNNVLSPYLNYWNSILGNATYDSTTKNITAVYQDNSGYLTSATLTINQIGALQTSNICTITNTSMPSGSMICYIGNATSSTFSYTLSGTLSNGDTNNIATGTLQYQSTSILFGNCSNPVNVLGCSDGVILTFLLVVVCASIGITISPAASLILMSAGVAVSGIIGLYAISLDTMVGLFVIVGIVIYKVRSSA
jgi:hypothetical protein